MTVDYPPELLAQIGGLCEADPDREVCGFVVQRLGGALEVEPIPNAAPAGRVTYLMDPDEQLRVHLRLRRQGGCVVAVYHSHPSSSAHLSVKDRSDALWDGKPVLSDVEYLVFGLTAGKVSEVRRYCWDGARFTEEELHPAAR